MLDNKIKKQIQEAMKAEFDLRDTQNKYDNIPIEEYWKQDIDDNLDQYGMHTENIPIDTIYVMEDELNDEDIKELVNEYKHLIMTTPSKIEEYLTDFAKDILNIDEEDY